MLRALRRCHCQLPANNLLKFRVLSTNPSSSPDFALPSAPEPEKRASPTRPSAGTSKNAIQSRRLARIANLPNGYSLSNVLQTYSPTASGPLQCIDALPNAVLLHFYSDLHVHVFTRFHHSRNAQLGDIYSEDGPILDAAVVARMGYLEASREFKVYTTVDNETAWKLMESFGPLERLTFGDGVFWPRFLDEEDAMAGFRAIRKSMIPGLVFAGVEPQPFTFPAMNKRTDGPVSRRLVVRQVTHDITTESILRQIYHIVQNDATLAKRAELLTSVRRFVRPQDDILLLDFLEAKYAEKCRIALQTREPTMVFNSTNTPAVRMAMSYAGQSGATRILKLTMENLPPKDVIEKDMHSFGHCGVTITQKHSLTFAVIQFYRLQDALEAVTCMSEGWHDLANRYTGGMLSFIGYPKQRTSPSAIVTSNESRAVLKHKEQTAAKMRTIRVIGDELLGLAGRLDQKLNR